MHLTRHATVLSAIFTLGGLTAILPAQAQTPIVPVSYTETPAEGQAQGGDYNFFDDTGKQLTDGILGTDDWTADLGNGNAYEWVAWRNADPTINFNFGQNVTIGSVTLGFNHTEANYIFLPESITINGTSFALDPTALADNTSGFVTFKGNWTGSNLKVTLADKDTTKWIFVDEAKFTSSPVPEASTTASFSLLLILGLGGLAVNVRRRKMGIAE